MREKNKREIFKRSKEVLRNVGVGQKGTKFNYYLHLMQLSLQMQGNFYIK